ncbi:MAG: hypothetical protein HKN29_02675 [Rhodothermales bacterium]|nr:hypothetical protein [Rhodothermales bacterium]
MSLTFGLSPWILIGLGLLAAAGAVWLYRGTVPRVEGLGRAVMSGLRFLSLGILIFLLVEPLLTRTVEESDPPVIAVLVDDSQSLAVASADSASAAAAATTLVETLRSGLPDADLRFYAFGARAGAVASLADADSGRFSQGRTDIAVALRTAAADLEDDNLQAVVLLSDGRYNTGQNPLHTADRYPVPIHTVTLGDTTSRRDVQVRRVLTNEIAYRDVALPMEVGIRHDGFGGQRVTVRVQSQGQVLDQETLVLPVQAGETAVQLEVVPDTTGLVRYQVSVSRSRDEFTYRNNVQNVTVRVLESRQRILVVAGAPDPDLTALRMALSEDDAMEMDVFVRSRSGGYFQGPLPDPSDYDLVVLQGYPSTGTSVADLDRIASAARNNVPMLFLLGHTTDLRLMQRLGPVLPVQPRVVRTGRTEGVLTLTAAGSRHPVFALSTDLPSDAWTSLPPLTVTDATWQSAPDATVLATASIRGVPLDDPLVVLRRRSGARSVAVLAYGVWRWNNLPASLELYDPVWPGLASNFVQWLVAPEDDRPVRVRPAQTVFEGGERVQFFGQVYDESAQPVSGATVDIDVRTPDGTVLPFAMRSIGSGRYRADAGALPEGTYSYTVAALQDNEELGRDQGTFSVGALALEFRDTQADAALMRQLALRSGGQTVFPDQVSNIPAALREGGDLTPRLRLEASSIRLWHRSPFLALVLVLLTVEWFLRKRRGLV